MHSPKILAFAGSTRKDSYNKKLLKIAVAGAQEAGAAVTVVDFIDLPMPIFNEDLEASEGMPANALKFKQLMVAHHGFLIASPEYNSSITALLKNSIDWASRSVSKDEKPLVAFTGKIAALMSASPGGLGGIRSLVTVRAMLENIGVMVLPAQRSIVKAHEAFNADGSLKSDADQAAVKSLGKSLAEIISKLHP